MSWIRVLAINFIVLLGLLAFLEIGWTVYDKTLRSKVECNLDWVLYNYCPEIKTTKLNHAADGGNLIEIQVDKYGGRVQIGSKSTLVKANNILIGDSFIQADEIAYDQTIYGLWNQEIKNTAYGLGYSSWNPIQYLDAIKHIGKTNSHYYVFLMTNDVMPSYVRSVSSELKNKDHQFIKVLRERFLYKFLTLVKRKVSSLMASNNSLSEATKAKIISDNFSPQKIQDCDELSELEGRGYSKNLGYDYLVFSKNYECWPEVHRNAFDEFVSITKDIENYVVTDLSSKLTFIWVSAGWAHQNQNSIGRLAAEYGFSNKINVTQKSLVESFKKRFPKVEVIDTEKVIASDLALCSRDCTDKYFFAIDGHWTPQTHSLILSYLNR